jgi:hypothetical protein
VIDTPQLQVDADNAKVSLAEMHEEYSRGIPIGRIGRADEIASAVALLGNCCKTTAVAPSPLRAA